MADPRRELSKAQPSFVPDFYRQRSRAKCMAPAVHLGWGHFFAVLLGIVIGYAYAHGQAINREARAERDMSAYEVLR